MTPGPTLPAGPRGCCCNVTWAQVPGRAPPLGLAELQWTLSFQPRLALTRSECTGPGTRQAWNQNKCPMGETPRPKAALLP